MLKKWIAMTKHNKITKTKTKISEKWKYTNEV